MPGISILDGAMGSELIRRGETLPIHIWSAQTNLTNPELVYDVHRDNILSGCQIITANTFRATPRSFAKTGLSLNDAQIQAKKSLLSAVSSAQRAAKNSIMVLGSIAPLEDCYMPDRFPGKNSGTSEYLQLGTWLKEAGVNGIILETMNNITEAEIALSVICSLDIPVFISFYLTDYNHLASGEHFSNAIYMTRSYPVEALLLNCSPINIILNAVDNLVNIWQGKWGIYPNLGLGSPSPDGKINNLFSDKDFIYLMEKSISIGAEIIGACCGSTPRHISLLKREFF